MNDRIVGTCSLCGSAVMVPGVWMGIYPPTPTCSGCGAHKADHGPVIEMSQPQRFGNGAITTTGGGCIYPRLPYGLTTTSGG